MFILIQCFPTESSAEVLGSPSRSHVDLVRRHAGLGDRADATARTQLSQDPGATPRRGWEAALHARTDRHVSGDAWRHRWTLVSGGIIIIIMIMFEQFLERRYMTLAMFIWSTAFKHSISVHSVFTYCAIIANQSYTKDFLNSAFRRKFKIFKCLTKWPTVHLKNVNCYISC